MIAFLQQLGQFDGLTSLLSAGGPTGVLIALAVSIRPAILKWLGAQVQATEENSRALILLEELYRRSEAREEQMLELIRRLPCQETLQRTHPHPAPGGVGHSTPTQSNR